MAQVILMQHLAVAAAVASSKIPPLSLLVVPGDFGCL